MRNVLGKIGTLAMLMLGTTCILFAQDKTAVIKMTNAATYLPAELVVKKGEKITWQNASDQIQTITVKTENHDEKQIAYLPDEAEPFSSGAIQPGESFSYTFFVPGTYEFISLPNEKKGMTGKIVVKD
jgi:plastocyanin